tara:strand:+ start:307 stop:594 length:288 start_codon:yes stop_codon:yes gene_type:complete
MIEHRIIEVNKGHEEIPFTYLTQDLKKDFYIIAYYLAEKLPDSVPFDLSNWEIIEYSEDLIVLLSNDKEWSIKLHQIYTYDEKLCIEYTFYVVRE